MQEELPDHLLAGDCEKHDHHGVSGGDDERKPHDIATVFVEIVDEPKDEETGAQRKPRNREKKPKEPNRFENVAFSSNEAPSFGDEQQKYPEGNPNQNRKEDPVGPKYFLPLPSDVVVQLQTNAEYLNQQKDFACDENLLIWICSMKQ